MANSKILEPFILKWEGGFVYDKDDLGGATNMGVTLATYRSVFGSKKTVNDLKRMTRAQWGIIFKKFYWDKWEADNIKDQNVANIQDSSEGARCVCRWYCWLEDNRRH